MNEFRPGGFFQLCASLFESAALPVRIGLTTLVTLLVVILSVTPGSDLPNDNVFIWLIATTPSLIQNLMHIVAYALLATMWVWSLNSLGTPRGRLLTAAFATVAMGIILEACQIYVAGRYATLLDVLMNVSGSLMGIALARQWQNWRSSAQLQPRAE